MFSVPLINVSNYLDVQTLVPLRESKFLIEEFDCEMPYSKEEIMKLEEGKFA